MAVEELRLADLQNVDTFWEALEPLLPMARRLAFAMLHSDADAEDAVQDAALSAWRHIRRFRPGLAFRPWFLKIVANTCRSRVRSRWWSVIRSGSLASSEPAPSQWPDPRTTDLRGALAQLPREQKLALVLRFYLDLPMAEVAQTLGISTQAAKSRIHRALERMRLSLEDLSDE